MRGIERILPNKIDDTYKLYSNIKFIIFTFSLISILGFLLIYNFLYGYYFSGAIDDTISNFSVISNFIPFDFRTLSITSFYFICIFYIIFGLVSLIQSDKKDKGKIILYLLFFAITITIMLTFFFANNLSFKSFFSFSLIWVFLGILVWFLFILINLMVRPTLLIKSTLLTFTLGAIITIILMQIGFDEEFLQPILLVILIILWPVMTTISIAFEKRNWMYFINCLPISFSILLVIVYLMNSININLNAIIDLLFLGFINIPIYYIVKTTKKRNKKGEVKKKITEDIIEDSSEVSSSEIRNDKEQGLFYISILLIYNVIVDRNENGMKMVLGALLLFVFVVTPQISMICGKGIRTINISEIPSTEIVYVNQNGIEKNVVANYYLENDSIIYISNKDWELEVIKPLNYHIK